MAALLVTSAAIGQWLLRLQLRKKWLCHGSSNQQALRRWRWTRRLAKLRRQDAPAALKELAQKAKFSQHPLTIEEMQRFDSFNRSCLRRLKEKPWYLRLAYRYGYAVY